MSKTKTTNQTAAATDTDPEQETIVHPAQTDPAPSFNRAAAWKEFKKRKDEEWHLAWPKSILPKKIAEKPAEEQAKYVEDTLAKLQARLAELTAFRNATAS